MHVCIILRMCACGYGCFFLVTVIKHYDQDNLQKGEFIMA